jgi:hypothetical protein
MVDQEEDSTHWAFSKIIFMMHPGEEVIANLQRAKELQGVDLAIKRDKKALANKKLKKKEKEDLKTGLEEKEQQKKELSGKITDDGILDEQGCKKHGVFSKEVSVLLAAKAKLANMILSALLDNDAQSCDHKSCEHEAIPLGDITKLKADIANMMNSNNMMDKCGRHIAKELKELVDTQDDTDGEELPDQPEEGDQDEGEQAGGEQVGGEQVGGDQDGDEQDGDEQDGDEDGSRLPDDSPIAASVDAVQQQRDQPDSSVRQH